MKKRLSLIVLTLLVLSACNVEELVEKIKETDTYSSLEQNNIEQQVKKFEKKLQEVENHRGKLQFVDKVDVYIKKEGGEGNQLVLIETQDELNSFNERSISEISLVQTLIRTLDYSYQSKAVRHTDKVVVGHLLYDTIIMNKGNGKMYFIKGEYTGIPLEVALFNDLVEDLNFTQFNELMRGRVPITD